MKRTTFYLGVVVLLTVGAGSVRIPSALAQAPAQSAWGITDDRDLAVKIKAPFTLAAV